MTARQSPRPSRGPRTLLQFVALFEEFKASSWAAWRAILARLTPTVREFYAVCGRGSGKSRIVALLACAFATRTYPRAPGEDIYVGIFAPDRKQARQTFRYVVGLLRAHPTLSRLIVDETRESVTLTTGVIIEVITASKAAPRGRSYACCIVEEAAFLGDEQSAEPDLELLRSLRPALARVPGSLLAVVSSPYRRAGILYDAWSQHHEHAVDDVVFVQASTRELNPLFDARAIDKAFAEDPTAAASEYNAEFRTDIESFLSKEAIAAVVVSGRREMPPRADTTYSAFLDFAGGSGGDSATLAIGHTEDRGADRVHVVDCLREVIPPFNPVNVCKEFAATLAAYRITHATADRWGGGFPVQELAAAGVLLEPSPKPKSDLYLDLLPVVNAGRIELLDHSRLVRQLEHLERRTGRSGKDAIDHRPGGRDDCANAIAGLVAITTGLGPPPLPATMTECRRRASGIRVDVCYLWAPRGQYASYMPAGDASCASCPGHRAVLALWKAHGEGLDLRRFRWERVGDNQFTERQREERARELVEEWAGTML